MINYPSRFIQADIPEPGIHVTFAIPLHQITPYLPASAAMSTIRLKWITSTGVKQGIPTTVKHAINVIQPGEQKINNR